MKQISAKKIYLVGMMGSGKSHWCTRLGRSMGLPAFDLDKLIENKAGLTIREIFETQGEEPFRQMESDALKNEVPADEFILACGGGTPCWFDNLAFMKENGLVIWLDPSVPELVKRIKKSPGTRPILASVKNDEELAEQLQKLLDERRKWYEQADIIMKEDLFSQAQLQAQISPYFKENSRRK
jgi:shikimate kinase